MQKTRLYGTSDGGRTIQDITPAAASALEAARRHGPILVGTGEGFDKCSADTLANMQTWWAGSPYFDINIYIGGASRACSQQNLTASWVNQVLSLGWRLIPTWVGPQAPCNAFSHKISSDPALADMQGSSEALAASDAAAALGLSAGVIYYDMEYYSPSDQSCDAAVKGFVNGWVRGLHSRNQVAGVYGSPLDAPDWATVASPPDAVWLAKWDNRATVWGLNPLSDSLWNNRNRLHQFMGGHNETWGGVTFNIDRDVEYGPVMGAVPQHPRTGLRPTEAGSGTGAAGSRDQR
ncbi:MAG: DUF1906 domain-containing protein [Acidobacteriia bacterium]|nr:DUF1906 domain-containing protein [Terriglobia bacterium]